MDIPFAPTDVSGTDIAVSIGAIGGLGIAAMGLVDASQIGGRGLANAGFRHIQAALTDYAPALERAIGTTWADDLKAHWRNGRPKAEQKAIASSLIQLGLSADNAAAMAKFGAVDGVKLAEAVRALEIGTALSEGQVQLVGRFKAAIDAKLDAAFERADQVYRNATRIAAGAIAVGLSIAATFIAPPPDGVASADLGAAIIVGLVAVPIAPITKDLISSLSAAVRAYKSVRP